MTRPVVAIDPVDTPLNSFVGRFARAVAAAGGDPVPMRWSLAELLRTDVVILHWPSLFMSVTSRKKAFAQLARFRVARWLRGTRLIWVAHNVAPHESKAEHDVVPRAFVRSLDCILYLSETSRRIVEAHYPEAATCQAVVTAHGLYDGESPPSAFVPPLADEPVRLLNFGLIRPYKNIEELIEATAPLPAGTVNVRIVGRQLDVDYAARLQEMVDGNDDISRLFSADILSEARIEQELDDAHGAVLPYRAILNSGSAVHALSRYRPVLVPALGSMPELAEQVGHDWIQLYNGRLTPERLADFARHVRTLPRGGRPDLSALSWGRVERDLVSLLEPRRAARQFVRRQRASSSPAAQ